MSVLPVLTVKLTEGQVELVNKYLALRQADDPDHFAKISQDIMLGTPFMSGIRQALEELERGTPA